MRIDLFNSSASQISSEASSQQVSPVALSSTSASSEDHATLSSDSTSVSSLVSQALSYPEVRQDKVDSLKQSINSGQYEIDPSKIAGSILDEHA
jgi:negative regulator of flagellin synthesis FlgM